jgi:hypothetical protein
MRTYASLGITGLNQAVAYRTRARIAFEANDTETLERHMVLAQDQVRECGWLRRERSLRRPEESPPARSPAPLVEPAMVDFMRRIESCTTLEERARCALQALMFFANAASGVVVGMTPSGGSCCVRLGSATDDLEQRARDYLRAQLDDVTTSHERTRDERFSPDATADAREGTRPFPILLCHPVDASIAVTGVAVLLDATNMYSPHLVAIATEVSRQCHVTGDLVPVWI